MERFCIISNSDKDKENRVADEMAGYITAAGKHCVIMKNQAMNAGIRERYTDVKKIPEDVECAIVLGGDGTMIQAANDLVHTNIPILGVNIGTLGFLTEVEKQDMEHALKRLMEDDYFIESRMMLKGTIDEKDKKFKGFALNDFVVSKSGDCRLITIKVYINEELADIYRADGLIVSTPTGSTGYNLSAGGPVLFPDMQCMSITPICPHSLNNRSLVISAADVLKIEIGRSKEAQIDEAVVMVDGNQVMELQTGETMVLTRPPEETKLIKLTKTCFFERMRKKLNGD